MFSWGLPSQPERCLLEKEVVEAPLLWSIQGPGERGRSPSTQANPSCQNEVGIQRDRPDSLQGTRSWAPGLRDCFLPSEEWVVLYNLGPQKTPPHHSKREGLTQALLLRTSLCPGPFVSVKLTRALGLFSLPPHAPPSPMSVFIQWRVLTWRRCERGSSTPWSPMVTRGPPPVPHWSLPGIRG